LPANSVLQTPIGHLLIRFGGPAKEAAGALRELHLPGPERDQAPIDGGQGRVAPRPYGASSEVGAGRWSRIASSCAPEPVSALPAADDEMLEGYDLSDRPGADAGLPVRPRPDWVESATASSASLRSAPSSCSRAERMAAA
jgi:hypothetical protein